ncbi:MAG: hypothetical protein ACFFBD_02070 [Candidatus Hodarchaeota archaeon]
MKSQVVNFTPLPQSNTVFTAGCNFRCLNCQNWQIAHYPSNRRQVEGVSNSSLIFTESRLFSQSRIENVSWAGFTGIPGMLGSSAEFQTQFRHKSAALAAYYAQQTGCKRIQRNCGICNHKVSRELKAYTPSRTT